MPANFERILNRIRIWIRILIYKQKNFLSLVYFQIFYVDNFICLKIVHSKKLEKWEIDLKICKSSFKICTYLYIQLYIARTGSESRSSEKFPDPQPCCTLYLLLIPESAWPCCCTVPYLPICVMCRVRKGLEPSRTAGWFASCPQAAKLFAAIHDFEPDCRLFLNCLNNSMGKDQQVFSVPAIKIFFSNVEVFKPCDPKYSNFWVDFRWKSSSILR